MPLLQAAINKKLKEINVDNAELLGAGANGRVYRVDEEQIVKVYNKISNPPEKIRREQESARRAFVHGIPSAIPFELSEQSRVNLPPRIRMSTLYAVSQSNNGRVANTCNLSEDWVGYSTRYGDSVGDFSPCSFLTVAEMKQIGRLIGLPDALIDKAPSDGLCGKTDEDNLGFTYAELDRYIREGVIEDQEHKALIDRKHELNKFKLELMPAFKPEI